VHHRLLRIVRLPALALVAACFATAAAAAPARISITSGTPQSARAWVAARANRYETRFDAALVVAVASPQTKVRFRCVTRGCEFPPSDQPDTVARVDGSAYDVTSVKGEASIKLTIWTLTPENVVVIAQPAGSANPRLRFDLEAR
jgi:hypothetical protein